MTNAKRKPSKKKYIKRDIYQEVTDRLIALIESDNLPWVKPWENTDSRAYSGAELPYNPTTGSNYTGINVVLLWGISQAYGSNAFLTYKQAQAAGGNVKKGEKGVPIIYWNISKKENDKGEDESFAFLKQYTVFNIAQCENLDPEKIKVAPPVEKCESPAPVIDKLIELNGIKVIYGGNKAMNNDGLNLVRMPMPEQFKSADHFAGTALHEFTHWTGSPQRLSRDKRPKGATEAELKRSYAFEELVAELGSAFLGAELGIAPLDVHNAAYLQSWLQCLKDDKKAIFKAAKLAQQAANYLQGRHDDNPHAGV